MAVHPRPESCVSDLPCVSSCRALFRPISAPMIPLLRYMRQSSVFVFIGLVSETEGLGNQHQLSVLPRLSDITYYRMPSHSKTPLPSGCECFYWLGMFLQTIGGMHAQFWSVKVTIILQTICSLHDCSKAAKTMKILHHWPSVVH